MTDFAIGRYASNDYRLVKWDGSGETEIGNEWSYSPEFEDMITALMDHHGVGDSPFNSRDAAVDAHLLGSTHIPEIDKKADHPWPWE